MARASVGVKRRRVFLSSDDSIGRPPDFAVDSAPMWEWIAHANSVLGPGAVDEFDVLFYDSRDGRYEWPFSWFTPEQKALCRP